MLDEGDENYEQLALICSDKSLASKRASRQCQRLFLHLYLKQQGVQVYECLVYDLDKIRVYLQIEKYDLSHKMKLVDDPRIKKADFDEDNYSMTLIIRTPRELAEYELLKSGKTIEDNLDMDLSQERVPDIKIKVL